MASSSSSSKPRQRRNSRASPRATTSSPRRSMNPSQAQDQGTRRPPRKRSRRSTLTLSVSPDAPSPIPPPMQPPQPRFLLGPEPSPTTPYLPVTSAPSRSRHGSLFISPESVEAVLAGSVTSSSEPCSTQAEHISERPSSTGTVRGPTTERRSPPPLTPFPPWIGDSEEEWQARGWQDPNQAMRAAPKRQRESIRYAPFAVVEVETRWLLSSIIHGIVLALQFSIALAVFSALISVAIWKKPDTDVRFWDWLWNFAEPSLVGVLILCSGTLVAHETKILSAVALLYLQCAILVVTTAASFIMWARCIEEYNRAVKGVLMGCNVLMWGLALFGFVRAAVVWKVEADVEDERGFGRGQGAQELTYGTFVPWNEAVRGQ
ncbi:hypothetical protein G7Z17_g4314 [Cylindrodendrum hubeiense]|uniref:Uncharacterized protein n=1 Tax=Cylindrodendrum hubeiense TaxID=595255 RepID=A0A9P5LA22_9HYPO|nr:hypothetical protein G7Z17_g4314 [Cylindrodendrum hubeiense]